MPLNDKGEYIAPIHWTDGGLNWDKPDPTKVDYLYALVKAVEERQLAIPAIYAGQYPLEEQWHYIRNQSALLWQQLTPKYNIRVYPGCTIPHTLAVNLSAALNNLANYYLDPDTLAADILAGGAAVDEPARDTGPLSFTTIARAIPNLQDNPTYRISPTPAPGCHLSHWAEWMQCAYKFINKLRYLPVPLGTGKYVDVWGGLASGPPGWGNWWEPPPDGPGVPPGMYFKLEEAYEHAMSHADVEPLKNWRTYVDSWQLGGGLQPAYAKLKIAEYEFGESYGFHYVGGADQWREDWPQSYDPRTAWLRAWGNIYYNNILPLGHKLYIWGFGRHYGKSWTDLYSYGLNEPGRSSYIQPHSVNRINSTSIPYSLSSLPELHREYAIKPSTGPGSFPTYVDYNHEASSKTIDISLQAYIDLAVPGGRGFLFNPNNPKDIENE